MRLGFVSFQRSECPPSGAGPPGPMATSLGTRSADPGGWSSAWCQRGRQSPWPGQVCVRGAPPRPRRSPRFSGWSLDTCSQRSGTGVPLLSGPTSKPALRPVSPRAHSEVPLGSRSSCPVDPRGSLSSGERPLGPVWPRRRELGCVETTLPDPPPGSPGQASSISGTSACSSAPRERLFRA